ncbi:MAG: MBL fold metallo-hydrolase [Acidobacteriota bacterium]
MKRLLLLGLLTAASIIAQPAAIEIHLIGTGGPELSAARRGPATLVSIGSNQFLFDAGRGVLDGLFASGLAPQNVTKIFLTHLHNDHIEGLPTLWITPWFLLGRQQPLEVWGPAGTRAMIDGMRRMFAHDLDRRSNAKLRRAYLDIRVHEIAKGEVYRDGSTVIRAYTAEHADGNPALSYRVESGGHAVLLTGDTTLTDTLQAASEGTDVIVANIAAGTPAIEASGSITPILAKLLRPEQAARLFTQAKPKLAVFSHIVKKGLPGSSGDEAILARVRSAGYTGPLVMGADRMRIRVGAEVQWTPPAAPPSEDLDGVGIVF